ncbi:DUF1361 domain-containing protein [Bacillus cereus group sp. BfR-BA-01380]
MLSSIGIFIERFRRFHSIHLLTKSFSVVICYVQ